MRKGWFASLAVLCLAIPGLVITAGCASAPSVAVPPVAELSWMLGEWSTGRGEREVRFDFYLKNEHRLEGTTRIFENRRLAYFEDTCIDLRDRGADLRLVTRRGQPRTLQLTASGEGFLVFENDTGNGARRLEYRAPTAGVALLEVNLEGVRDGEPFRRDLVLRRPIVVRDVETLEIGHHDEAK